ncbi:MAG: PepSY-like domain-containing protein [Bacteroidales bacterium]|nr:PepSY-like domain-containing protein [Bacteroidales bacterium]
MKLIKLLSVAAVCLLFTAVSCAHDRIIPVTQLPAQAQTFIKTYFADKTVAYAKQDGAKYEVKFNDGAEVEFDRKGNWDNVDCKFTAVPEAIVPEQIKNYVAANHPGALITKIDKERYGYEIELSNSLELKFDRNFNLFDIDD